MLLAKRDEEELCQLISQSNNKRNSFSDSGLSMWSCRKCTLDNPLQDKVCAACGGSRLSSIGDIDIPRMLKCETVLKMIQEVEKNDDNSDEFFCQ